jgi:hypothetical protein
MTLLLLGAALFLSVAVAAPAALAAEPIAERIVRVSFVDGDASYQRGDADGWSALGLNTPLMTGDSIYTARGGRAEVSLGRGSYARLSDGTQLDMVSLTSDVTQLGVTSGQMSFRVRSMPQGSAVEVDTPYATATIASPGLYRISVDDDGAAYEVVSGGMSVAMGGEQLDVSPNESLSLQGLERPTYEYAGLRPSDRFDDWATARDQRFERAQSARYVHADVQGQEDLDAYGTWRPHPQYGQVWVPSGVGTDWAPYQSGRWVWQDPYGWTWVSYEGWGWAPYHYGRWVYLGGTWAWVPPPPSGYVAVRGVVMPEPVYAPALVAFIGGSNWSVSVSMGGGSSIGWVPLAPAERYYYPWQPAPRVVNHYTNVTVVNAVTVVQQNNFINGGGTRVKVDRRMISRAPVMGCRPEGVAPTQESLAAYPHRRLNEGAVPVRRGQQRPLVARLVPPARPTPFKDKAEVIRKTGRPVERPVDFAGDVGKPFHKGVRAPQGVTAVSALEPEKPTKMAPRGGGKTARAPRPIESADEAVPPHQPQQGKPAGRPGRGPAGPRQRMNTGRMEPVADDADIRSSGGDRVDGGMKHTRLKKDESAGSDQVRIERAGATEPVNDPASTRPARPGRPLKSNPAKGTTRGPAQTTNAPANAPPSSSASAPSHRSDEDEILKPRGSQGPETAQPPAPPKSDPPKGGPQKTSPPAQQPPAQTATPNAKSSGGKSKAAPEKNKKKEEKPEKSGD